MSSNSEVEVSQVRNIKNKIVDHIRKAPIADLLKIAMACNVKVPKSLTDKYLK